MAVDTAGGPVAPKRLVARNAVVTSGPIEVAALYAECIDINSGERREMGGDGGEATGASLVVSSVYGRL